MISLALLLAALSPPAGTAGGPGEVDTIYDTSHGMITLVSGDEPPQVTRGIPTLVFRDEAGATVRVYAVTPIGLREARWYLRRCRDARARVAAVRRHLVAKAP